MKLIKKCLPGNTLDISLLDYIAQRIQDKRDSASFEMNNKSMSVPVEKRVPKEGKLEELDEDLFNALRQVNLNYINLLNAYNSSDKSLIDVYKKNYLDAQADLKKVEEKRNNILNSKDLYVTVNAGPNCLYTYTDNYGKDRRVAGNETWLSKGKSGKPVYEEKGFKKLSKDDVLLPSDLVLTVAFDRSRAMLVPIHSVMFNRYQNTNLQDGKLVIKASYSVGAVGDKAMKHQVNYPYSPGVDNAFRFVGNAADSARWTREYNELLNRLANHATGGKLIKHKL